MAKQSDFNLESIKKKGDRWFYTPARMTGSDGAPAPMMKHLLESMITGELEH